VDFACTLDMRSCSAVPQMRVVSDESCVPELRPEAFKNITGDMSFGVSGWVKQQLIKLSCSFTIQVSICACCCSRCSLAQ
jgi:hypothetical protein